MTSPTILPVIHFNDVYKMGRPKVPTGKGRSPRIIDNEGLINTSFDHIVAFSTKIRQIRKRWATNKSQGLLLFSGDLFSPSVESVLTRGSNMVHIMNELVPDACVPGNHEFDFGRQRFDQLIEFCNFRWTLSNIKGHPLNPRTGEADRTRPVDFLNRLREYDIIERSGLTIGIIGLMSKDALRKTNPAVTSTLERTMLEMNDHVALASRLRLPQKNGKKGCDLVFALTHAKHEEDVEIAKATHAYPADWTEDGKALEHIAGIDLIFGGHDHEYYLGQGIKLVGETELEKPKAYRPRYPGDEDLLIVKSGTDFDDMSEVEIIVEDRPNGTERKKIIRSVTVTRHQMNTLESDLLEHEPDLSMDELLERLFRNEVINRLDEPVATTKVPFAVDKNTVRLEETAVGNWIASAMLRWYNHFGDGEETPSAVPAQVYIMTAGSIRGGITLGPGKVSAKDIVQLVPFDTPLVALDVTGNDLRAALNSALAPSSRGSDGKLASSSCFPVISGIKVEWDSREMTTQPDGTTGRVKKIWLVKDDGSEEDFQEGGKYRVLTNVFLAGGGDGFTSFENAERHSTYAELPMHQVLRYYISDLLTVNAYSRLRRIMFESIISRKQSSETEELIRRLESLIPSLTSENSKRENAAPIIRRVADMLFESERSEQYLPELDINPKIDNRLLDSGEFA